MLIDLSAASDDLIECIVGALVIPLQKKARVEKRISKTQEDNTSFERAVYAYFNVLSVSKQFNRVASKLDFDWLALAGNPYGNYRFFRDGIEEEQRRQEAELSHEEKKVLSRRGLPYLSETPKKMLRMLVYCDNGLPMIREEIDCFIRKHKLGYKSKKIGRRYDPLKLGVRKLKTIKVQPLSADTQFKAIIKRHELLNKKRLRVEYALRDYAEKVSPPKNIIRAL